MGLSVMAKNDQILTFLMSFFLDRLFNCTCLLFDWLKDWWINWLIYITYHTTYMHVVTSQWGLTRSFSIFFSLGIVGDIVPLVIIWLIYFCSVFICFCFCLFFHFFSLFVHSVNVGEIKSYSLELGEKIKGKVGKEETENLWRFLKIFEDLWW